MTSLAAFGLLLIGLPAAQRLGGGPGVALFSSFYRSGALVFGGGHVVLPCCATRSSPRVGSATAPFSRIRRRAGHSGPPVQLCRLSRAVVQPSLMASQAPPSA